MSLTADNNEESASNLDKSTEDLIAFVDGEPSTPGVDTYEFKFRTSDLGDTELVMAANDARGGAWGTIKTATAGQLHSALLDWQRLIELEIQESVMVHAARHDPDPSHRASALVFEVELAELRQRLFRTSV